MKKLYLIFLFVLSSFASFSQIFGKVYTPKNVEQLVRNHNSFAIIPFTINYQQRSNKQYKLSEEEVESLSEKLAYETQTSMFSFTMKKAGKGNLLIQPQDIDITNALLLKKNISPDQLILYTPAEICEILNVDAVLGGTITIKETMSQGAAAVTEMILDYEPNTANGVGQIKLTDEKGNLLFNYGKKVVVGLGEDSTEIIEALMRKSANRFPYFTKSKNIFK